MKYKSVQTILFRSLSLLSLKYFMLKNWENKKVDLEFSLTLQIICYTKKIVELDTK